MHRSRTSRTPGSPPWRARAASACWTTPSCSPGVLGALGSCMQGSSAMFGEASDVCMRPCRSLKKEEKLRQKKSAAWKERQGLQRKDQAAKQKKCGRACCCQRFRVPHCRLTPAPVCCRRADNLKARVDTKLKNKKDKREKKLLRAGFEGRRDTFIGSDK